MGVSLSGSVERRNVDRLKKLTSERASVGGGGGGERKVNKRTSARVKERAMAPPIVLQHCTKWL